MIVSHMTEMIVSHVTEMIATETTVTETTVTETTVTIDHHEVVVDAAVGDGADAVAWEAEQI